MFLVTDPMTRERREPTAREDATGGWPRPWWQQCDRCGVVIGYGRAIVVHELHERDGVQYASIDVCPSCKKGDQLAGQLALFREDS